jgi:Tol biopolymer transport system component
MCAFVVAAGAARAGAADFERISVSSSGEQGFALSCCPSVTPDGRFVAFVSDAALAPGAGTFRSIYVRDRASGTTELQGGPGSWPTISANGRRVVWDDLNSVIWLRDRLAGTTSFVAVGFASTISRNGRYVAFATTSALTPDDTNGLLDVYVKDVATGTFTRGSRAATGVEPNGDSSLPTLDALGRFVAFTSTASNLGPGDTNDARDVYVRDLVNGTTERLSVASDGSELAGASTGRISMSDDSRFVAFNTDFSINVRDRQLRTTTGLGPGGGASVSPDGSRIAFDFGGVVSVWSRATGTTDVVAADFGSFAPALSLDGIALYSISAFVPSDTNGAFDVYYQGRDTTAPVVTATLEPGWPVVPRRGTFVAQWSCIDDRDPSPASTGMLNDLELANPTTVILKQSSTSPPKVDSTHDGQLVITAPSFLLTVRCADAAGNSSETSVAPVFPDPWNAE